MPVCTQLVQADFSDPHNTAALADTFWQLNHLDHPLVTAATTTTLFLDTSAIHKGHRPWPHTPPDSDVCFYHHKFGKAARKCRAPCKFSGNSQASQISLVAGSSALLYALDIPSGKHFLIDTGAEVSIFPSPPTHRQHLDSPTLVAANGTHIHTFGKHILYFHIG